MKDISRQLFSRGLHRSFGNSSLGTLSAFLTVIILIRSLVNLYFTAEISTGGEAVMELRQITAGWYLYIAAYIITCSSLSAYHINFALPSMSFLNISPRGLAFKNVFLKQSVMLRPMNIVFILLIATGSLVFISAGCRIELILFGLLFIGISVLAAALVFKLADLLSTDKTETQILESVLLLMLVMMNPDVINQNGSVVMLVQAKFFHFESAAILLIFTACIFFFTCALLFFTKLLSLLNNKIKFTQSSNPITSWYWKFFTPKYWLILYLFVIPFMLTPAFSETLKFQIAAVLIFFTAFSFILFLNHCQNNIKRSLRNLFTLKNNLRLFVNTMLAHLALTLLPLSAMFIRI